MAVFIYALIDPTTERIRYIGNTGDIQKRFECHLREKRNTPKCAWVEDLLNCGLQPKIEVLEVVNSDPDTYLDAEAKWIRHGLTQGWPLFNCIARGLTNELFWYRWHNQQENGRF